MNAYFQLECKAEGSYLYFHPATEGGEPLNVNEVAEYLAKKNFSFDIRNLNQQIIATNSNGVIKLDDKKHYPEREMAVVKVAPDKMSAEVRFYPPSVGGNLLSKEDIIADLNAAKVTVGIDKEAIDAFLAKREYCKDYVMANGKFPRHGTDATIEYFFNTDLSARPALKEDGSVDFFNLNNLNHIKAGDLLAKLTKEDPGEHGMDVCGARVKARDVKKQVIKYGRNIKISEDGTEAYSEVNGHVMLVEGKIFVSDVYQVQNVDNSTGNIEYEGSVQIQGNVATNFSVKAKGNIEVMGVVEGAYLEAEGNIIVAKGINGMGKGTVRAGGNVIVKYIENATVFSGGYVETEAIMHSTVSARTEVNVTSKKGIISGSVVNATNAVNVKNLGSQMGSDTVVELGMDPTLKERMVFLRDRMESAQKTLRQLQPFVVAATQKIKQGVKFPPEQLKSIQDSLVACKKLQDQLADDEIEMDEIKDSFSNKDTSAQVVVRNVIYAGTKIAIFDSSMITKEDYKFCKFTRRDGDIKMSSL